MLGATGSIGRQALECIRTANGKEPGRYLVTGLAAGRDAQALLEAAKPFPEALLALSSPTEGPRKGDNDGIRYTGPRALASLLENIDVDLVVNGVSGARGLEASVASLSRGCTLALANKESVVMGWPLLRSMAKAGNLDIIPVDSEHASLFQLLSRIGPEEVANLTITASGGPFRTLPLEALASISPAEAARHPVWKMGRKISIDSATLANKGLELIEAVRLFSVPDSRVSVLVHPESLVHAMVETIDGALYAYISEPDMRHPIELALAWPEKRSSDFGRVNLAGKTLRFEAPDEARFPMLSLARQAVSTGEAATIAYNAADEIAVEAFENGRIGFLDIASVVRETLSADWAFPAADLVSIFEFDEKARALSKRAVSELAR